MNDLKGRFEQHVLTVEQKQRIVEVAKSKRHKSSMSFVPIVLPSFLVLAILFVVLQLMAQPESQLQTTQGMIPTIEGEVIETQPSYQLPLMALTLVLLYYMRSRLHDIKIWQDNKFVQKLHQFVKKYFVLLVLFDIFGFAIVLDTLELKYQMEIFLFSIFLVLFIVLLLLKKTEHSKEGNFVKRKSLTWLAVILLTSSMIIYLTIDTLLKIEATATLLNYPTRAYGESFTLGIVGACLCIGGFICVLFAVRIPVILVIFVVLPVYLLLPNYVHALYQETFASGVQAVSYNKDGYCNFEQRSNSILQAHCQLSFHNHSGEPVTFELQLFDIDFFGYAEKTIDRINSEGPFIITIGANESQRVTIDEQIQLLKDEDFGYLDSTTHFYVRLKDEYSQVIYQ